MSNQTSAKKPSTTDQILDLLLDALVERQKARRPQARQEAPMPKPPAASEQRPEPEKEPARPIPPPRPEPPPSARRPVKSVPPPQPKRQPKPGDEGGPVLGQTGTREPPPRLPSIHMGKMLARLAILIVALIILVNIPVTRYGVSLARIMPETSSLIIRDGLVLKGSGPEIYMLEEGKLRWISSLDAFEHLGLTWDDVHVVEDEFLAKFEKGRPIHVLLKCRSSPHIYRLENNQKRWIKDIDTFLAEGHVWDDVRFVSCDYLRGIPDGPPIPEDAGPPPQP